MIQRKRCSNGGNYTVPLKFATVTTLSVRLSLSTQYLGDGQVAAGPSPNANNKFGNVFAPFAFNFCANRCYVTAPYTSWLPPVLVTVARAFSIHHRWETCRHPLKMLTCRAASRDWCWWTAIWISWARRLCEISQSFCCGVIRRDVWIFCNNLVLPWFRAFPKQEIAVKKSYMKLPLVIHTAVPRFCTKFLYT